MALPMRTAPMVIEGIAERTGHSKGVVKVILAALEDEVREAVESCERVKVAGVQIEPKLKPASKARVGRNPKTGEDVKIAAKPASVAIKARVLAALKNNVSLPSVKKLKNASGK